MNPSDLPSCEDLHVRFGELDAFLCAHQQLWRPKPFTQLELDWEQQYPQLSSWLRGRSLEQAEAAHNQPHLLCAPSPFPELAQMAQALSQLQSLPVKAREPVNPRLSVDVPGRKWDQIEAFSRCLSFEQKPEHWLDWCAGKGHLGRYLAQQGYDLTCLEIDSALASHGQLLSDKLKVPASHLAVDVMQASASGFLDARHTPVALHACGDLHTRLMQLASDAGCHQLAIAPCCYNRTRNQQYQALSSTARKACLRLSKEDLGLIQCETVTAGQRVRVQRDLSMARRLGFDLLQREIRGVDQYLNSPSLPTLWLKRPFAEYCAELAQRLNLSITTEQDWPARESAGWRRLAQVRNLELLRDLFRRPLEIWLILDRALYLKERGYEVRLGSFCETRLTPRNLLLLAERTQIRHSPVDNSVDGFWKNP